MPCFDRAAETAALWDHFMAGRNLLREWWLRYVVL